MGRKPIDWQRYLNDFANATTSFVITVSGSEVRDWRRLYGGLLLRKGLPIRFFDGKTPIPNWIDIASGFNSKEDTSLTVTLDGLVLRCSLNVAERMVFSFPSYEVNSRERLQLLLGFLTETGRLLNKEILLGPSQRLNAPLFRYVQAQNVVIYTSSDRSLQRLPGNLFPLQPFGYMLEVSIDQEPRGSVYHTLIDYATQQCQEFFLVMGPEDTFETHPSAQQILKRLSSWLVYQELTKEWPGTKTEVKRSTVYYYRCDPKSASVLKGSSNGLFDWHGPQDLCFLRTRKDPWLMTTTHEEIAYFDVHEEELKALKAHVPGLKLNVNHIPQWFH